MKPKHWGAMLVAMAAAAIIAVVALRFATRPLPPPRNAPNVIFLVLDTLRADRLGTYGSSAGLTPFLDRFAAESEVYERAYTASPWTVPSVASMFLAQWPSEHQVVRVESVVPRADVTLAEVLRRHGYRTGGFSANIQIRAEHGFNQGFEVFPPLHENLKGDAKRLNAAALAWLDDSAGRERPFFLYMQYMEPHNPYRSHEGLTPAPPAGLQASDADLDKRLAEGAFAAGLGKHDAWTFSAAEVGRLLDLYDGEVRYLDARLAELFDGLRQRGLLRHTLVIVTADHGEEFGEHGVFDHGISLFQAAIHVPLIVRLPDDQPPRRIAAPVQLAGLAPAVLREIGLPLPPEFHVGAIPFRGAVSQPAYAYSERVMTQPLEFVLHRKAVIGRAEKLVVTDKGADLYYDLAADPGERQPLPSPPTVAADLLRVLSRHAAVGTKPAAQETAPLDAATRERLRSLGYAH